MLNNKSIIVLFAGYSVNNTPKLKNLINSLKKEGYEVSLFGIVKHLSYDLVNVNVTHLYSKGNKQGIIKIVAVSYYVLKLIFALVFTQKNSMIYTINPVSGIIALVSSAFSSKIYIYESHEMVFGLNYPYFRGKWRHFWSFIEKNIVKRSEYFFTTDAYRLKFIRRYYKIKNDNIGYILNVPPIASSVGEKEKNQIKFNFEDQFVVSYCGGIIEGRGIESIIEAFAEFQKETKKSVLLLAGSIEDNYQELLINQIKKSGINSNKVIFTGKLDNDTLMSYMSASDVTFALYSNVSLNNRMCSPNKVFDALHSQTYVITTKSFLTTDIVSKNNIGEILHSINPSSIVSALEECYNKRNNQITNERWEALQLKYCWESEFERVKKHII